MMKFKNVIVILCILAIATPVATACPRFFARHRVARYNACQSRVTYSTCQPMATHSYCQPRVTYSTCQPSVIYSQPSVKPEVKKDDCPTCNTVVPHLVKFEGPEQPVKEETDEPKKEVEVVKVEKQRGDLSELMEIEEEN